MGALEIPVRNDMLANADLNFVVNFYDERLNQIFGNENNGDKEVIMIYLNFGHFELLTPMLQDNQSTIADI